MTQQPSSADHRQYLRLPSVIPVAFSIVHLQDQVIGIGWLKGTTQNVSEGGMCLETASLNESMIHYLSKANILLDLRLSVPSVKTPIKAIAEVAWSKRIENEESKSFIIGLKFKSIVADDLKTILGQAKTFVVTSRLIIAVCLIFFIILIFIGVSHYKKAVERSKIRYNLDQIN